MNSTVRPAGNRASRGTAAVALAALLFVLNFPTAGQAAAGPFAGLDGTWTGGGTLTLASGTREPLRCRVQYLVQNDDTNLQQSLRCASDSYKFQVNAYIDSKGGSLSGQWTETTQNASGRVSGQVSGGQVRASVQGPGFSASVAIATSGNDQSVTITPKGKDLDIRGVSIRLRKR